jgi:hypothetical protein
MAVVVVSPSILLYVYILVPSLERPRKRMHRLVLVPADGCNAIRVHFFSQASAACLLQNK